MNPHNEDCHYELVESIVASSGTMRILIAVCSDSILQNSLIEFYETELEDYYSFAAYRLKLGRVELSLREAIAEVVEEEPYLSQGGIAVLTVTGIEKLLDLQGFDGDLTIQDILSYYLQWTREDTRQFTFPIVIWLDYDILNQIINSVPELWSYRSGVFRFRSEYII